MSGPRRTKQEIVSEFRCAEILDAAQKVFARKGFNGATVDEIAETAGLAKGTVYLYFQSKRKIYLEALKKGLAGLIEQTTRNVDAAPGAADKIRAFIRTRINYAQDNRDFIAIYHSEFMNIGGASPNKEFRDLCLRQARALAAVLQEASAQGQIRPVCAEAAAFLVYEMTRGLITRRMLGWSKASADEDIEFLFDLIWKGLAIPCQPAELGAAACTES